MLLFLLLPMACAFVLTIVEHRGIDADSGYMIGCEMGGILFFNHCQTLQLQPM